MTVPVRTENFLRQSRQRYGIVACLHPSWTFSLPHRGQPTPLGQRTPANQRSAASSSGNFLNSSASVMPLR